MKCHAVSVKAHVIRILAKESTEDFRILSLGDSLQFEELVVRFAAAGVIVETDPGDPVDVTIRNAREESSWILKAVAEPAAARRVFTLSAIGRKSADPK